MVAMCGGVGNELGQVRGGPQVVLLLGPDGTPVELGPQEPLTALQVGLLPRLVELDRSRALRLEHTPLGLGRGPVAGLLWVALTLDERGVCLAVGVVITDSAAPRVQEDGPSKAHSAAELLLLPAESLEARLLSVPVGIRPRLLRSLQRLPGPLEALQLRREHSCGERIPPVGWETSLRPQGFVPPI